MKKSKEIKVDSLSDYVNAIEVNKLSDCISRGEWHKYKQPLVSYALRVQKDENILLKEYFYEVETQISDFQKQHFLAFAQHHGLPTCLLDTSFSALVSLYFAVKPESYIYPDDKNDDALGRVYFFKKDKCVNIDKIIFNESNRWNLISLLVNYDESFIKFIDKEYQIYPAFEVDYYEPCFRFCIRRIIKLLRILNFKNSYKLENSLREYIKLFNNHKNNKQDSPFFFFDKAINDMPEILYDITESFDFINNNIKQNVLHDLRYRGKIFIKLLLIVKFIEINLLFEYKKWKGGANFFTKEGKKKADLIKIRDSRYGSVKNENEFYLPWNFTYKPPLFDERIINQQSLFIYQSRLKNVRTISVPDFTILINDREVIYRQLDSFGINEKHIYSDFDHIAHYVSISKNSTRRFFHEH